MSVSRETVTLNLAERWITKYISTHRDAFNRRHGSRELIRNNNPQKSTFQGVGAEIGFAKLFNVYFDTEIGIHPPMDCTLPDGRTVDVKQTGHERGKLLVLPRKEYEKVDLYALMVGEVPRFRFAGFFKAVDLFVPERFRKYPFDEYNYVASQGELFMEGP